MSYRFSPEESLAAGLRRSDCERLEHAMAGLADAKPARPGDLGT